ncbi:uncharacterized protein LOC141629918 [Silene latifolia]|uniref:uncharacterized protein LOC141629918 n=1 Tax=Silene latifolia TaxID=37657 RepID=UPI003D772B06
MRDSRFISKFWQELENSMGTTLKMTTAFHPATDGQTGRTIQTLEDMLRPCDDETLYGRKCRSLVCWDDIADVVVLGPKMIQEMVEQFEVRDKVLLKLSPMKGVMRFGKRCKLTKKYIGPYEILDRVEEVAYRLALPPALDRVYNVFHVSQLGKYVSDPSHILEQAAVEVDDSLSYVEVAKEILDMKVRKTRAEEIVLVQVIWSNHNVEEATREAEDAMRAKYHIFSIKYELGYGT